MRTFKKLLTKYYKRGKPIVLALLTCIVVAGLATGIVWFNDYLGVKADTKDNFDVLKAYDGAHLEEFVKTMEDHFSADGSKGKYGLDLDANGGFLQCTEYDCEKRTLSGTKITKSMLKEKCNPDDPKSPSRYWFWIKARNYDGGGAVNECDDWITEEGKQSAEVLSRTTNTLVALSNFGRGDWRNGLSLLSSSLKTPRIQAGSYSTWHTEYYYTSTNPLDHKVNAKSGENCVKVPMANLKEGGIIADAGNSLSGNRKLSFYATDIKDFYDMMVEDDKWYAYTGRVYLHTVVGVKGGSGHKSDIYKENEWESICGTWPSVQWELKQSYNQYLDIDDRETPITLQVYAVKSEGDKVTEEEMEFHGEYQLGEELENRNFPKFTSIDFSGIKTFKDPETGQKYKLKGIVLKESAKGNWKDEKIHQAFVVQDGKIFGTKKKTNEYSDKSHSKKNIKGDSLTGKECVVEYLNEAKIKLDGDKFKGEVPKAKKHPEPGDFKKGPLIETPSGKISEKELQEILTDVTWKIGQGDTRICLIYQAAKEAEVTLKTDVYDWDGEKYESISNENPVEVTLGKLSASGESGPFNLTSNMVKPKTGENRSKDYF